MKKLTAQQKARKAWLRALRSGKYKQGYGYLHYEGRGGQDRFCCLGVLCDLAAKRGVTPPLEKEGKFFEYEGNSGCLPENVKHWVGLQNVSGDFGRDRSLAVINDTRKYSFEKIADIIESEPEGLFVD